MGILLLRDTQYFEQPVHTLRETEKGRTADILLGYKHDPRISQTRYPWPRKHILLLYRVHGSRLDEIHVDAFHREGEKAFLTPWGQWACFSQGPGLSGGVHSSGKMNYMSSP